ncbi:MAG: DUF3352 domain-containing protein [Candidatus Sericytochromatia bacterium]
MPKLAQRLSSLTLATTLLLLLNPSLTPDMRLNMASAHASLDQTLEPYPADTLALVSVSLDLKHWSYLISRLKEAGSKNAEASSEATPDEDVKLPAEFNRLIDFMQKDLQFDPLRDGLLNLGSHLTLAYHPYAGSNGHLLFSLNLRSPGNVQGLMTRFKAQMAKRENPRGFKIENFGGKEIYSLSLQKKQQKSDQMGGFNRLYVAVSGQNLIGAIGPGPELIQRMLYQQAVLPAASRFRLSNQPLFSPVRKSLQDKAIWFYLDTKGALKAADLDGANALAEQNGSDIQMLAFLEQVTNLTGGMGLGVDIDREGLNLKTFIAPDQQHLTPVQQEYLAALNQEPEHRLKGLLEAQPGEPLLMSAGQHLELTLTRPLPFDMPIAGLEAPDGAKMVREMTQKLLNVDYEKEFLPVIDGRYGFGVFEPASKEGLPQMVMYLGLKSGQEANFDKLMQQKFRIRPEAVTTLFEEAPAPASVKTNLTTLWTTVETFGVDWGGIYPANLAHLQKEAQTQGREYWKDFANPVSGESGMGQSLADYSSFRAEPAFAGMVFYQPAGEKIENADGTFYTAYELYGYDPDGQLYRRKSGYEQDNVIETLREDLPRVELKPEPSTAPGEVPDTDSTIIPKQLELWQGTPIYTLPVMEPIRGLIKEMLTEEKKPTGIKANMHTFQTIAETFAVDWGGVYAANLAHLKKEAEQEGRQYWKDFANPVSGETGVGQSVDDYSSFKADLSLAGRVFYQPTGESHQDENGTFYTNYLIYGYDADGTLYSLNQNGDFATVRQDLPKFAKPAASAEPERGPEAMLDDIQPVFARKGDIWMLALHPDTLKAALAGGKSAKIEHWVQRTGSEDASGLFFFDLQSTTSLIKRLLPQEALDSEEVQEVVKAFEPWQSLFAASRQLSTGTEGQMAIKVDLDKVDFKEVGKTLAVSLSSFEGAQTRARISSVKANMHMTQTIVETYAVDYGGIYPATVAEMVKEAQQRDYWREFTNPFSQESGMGPALIDYQDYKPGAEMAGKVLYQPAANEDGQITSYKIYGVDQAGALILDKGETFFLSNS